MLVINIKLFKMKHKKINGRKHLTRFLLILYSHGLNLPERSFFF